MISLIVLMVVLFQVVVSVSLVAVAIRLEEEKQVRDSGWADPDSTDWEALQDGAYWTSNLQYEGHNPELEDYDPELEDEEGSYDTGFHHPACCCVEVCGGLGNDVEYGGPYIPEYDEEGNELPPF